MIFWIFVIISILGVALFVTFSIIVNKYDVGKKFVRAHHLSFDDVLKKGEGSFLIDATSYPNINELYCAGDILILDYSSAFFDFGLLNKSLYCYEYDYEQYRDDYDELTIASCVLAAISGLVLAGMFIIIIPAQISADGKRATNEQRYLALVYKATGTDNVKAIRFVRQKKGDLENDILDICNLISIRCDPICNIFDNCKQI